MALWLNVPPSQLHMTGELQTCIYYLTRLLIRTLAIFELCQQTIIMFRLQDLFYIVYIYTYIVLIITKIKSC